MRIEKNRIKRAIINNGNLLNPNTIISKDKNPSNACANEKDVKNKAKRDLVSIWSSLGNKRSNDDNQIIKYENINFLRNYFSLDSDVRGLFNLSIKLVIDNFLFNNFILRAMINIKAKDFWAFYYKYSKPIKLVPFKSI